MMFHGRYWFGFAAGAAAGIFFLTFVHLPAAEPVPAVHLQSGAVQSASARFLHFTLAGAV